MYLGYGESKVCRTYVVNGVGELRPERRPRALVNRGTIILIAVPACTLHHAHHLLGQQGGFCKANPFSYTSHAVVQVCNAIIKEKDIKTG